MTRLNTPWWPLVRYDCDGIEGDGICHHEYADDGWGYSGEFYEFGKPWRMLKNHGWTHYALDGWTHHRCGHCNNDLEGAKGNVPDCES